MLNYTTGVMQIDEDGETFVVCVTMRVPFWWVALAKIAELWAVL